MLLCFLTDPNAFLILLKKYFLFAAGLVEYLTTNFTLSLVYITNITLKKYHSMKRLILLLFFLKLLNSVFFSLFQYDSTNCSKYQPFLQIQFALNLYFFGCLQCCFSIFFSFLFFFQLVNLSN